MRLVLMLLIFAILHSARSALSVWPTQEECGKLSVENFYKPKNVTELNEYPWIARVAYEDIAAEVSYRCLAVLISRRYLLSAAHCFSNKALVVNHVLLGDWSTENNPSERDCDERGKCAPPPKKYQVEEIVVHPDYNRHSNDMTLLRLTTDVIFNEYISPVCMPSRETDDNDYTGQFLPYVGFSLRSNNELDRRTKVLLHVTSKKSCTQSLKNYRVNLGDNYICGISNSDTSLMSGSPLMGVKLVDGEPHSFYVLGMVTAGAFYPGTSVPDVFVRISAYREWLEFNVVE